jgi:hypothetical protein
VSSSARYDRAAEQWLRAHGYDVPDGLPRGEIVGSVEAHGAVRDSQSPWAMPGHWHWLLGDAQAATRSVRVPGQLQIFRAPAGWQEAFPA